MTQNTSSIFSLPLNVAWMWSDVCAASLFPRSGLWAAELLAATLASLPANAIRIPAEVTKQRVQVLASSQESKS